MNTKKTLTIFTVCVALTACAASAQDVQYTMQQEDSTLLFTLSNAKVSQQVLIRDSMLAGDRLSGQPSWLARSGNPGQGVTSDGNFALKMMWTDWSAPGRDVNADVQISFTKKDYRFSGSSIEDMAHGGKELQLLFHPIDKQNTILVRITYQLLPGKFYARRRIAVRDTVKQSNWLDTFISRGGLVASDNRDAIAGMPVVPLPAGDHEAARIVKKGAFGQPAAISFGHSAVFFGVEYPAATTTVKHTKAGFGLSCREIIGTVVKDKWVESKWVVEGLAPDGHAQLWFDRYLPDIRVAPLRPYALYNSWFDLHAPTFKHLAPEHVMNEKNIMDIIEAFKKDMIAPYGIHLDAFVLDDGWDVHHSDWQLRQSTFPHGLKPIADTLRTLGTTLGIWFGPTGGYSFRNDRISWMGDHGYEVTGHGSDAMMCIGGKKYGALFQKRTTDMVRDDGVGYFKWDGIQFSCSDPTHGHPTGYYSRRALLDSLIAKCRAVRAINPDVYLNITSGTWLSPWWVKYANQIWMQGSDYGFADVPSVSNRDASMTYKDFVLYDDLRAKDCWFPISNLMTHGIIKGALNEIGSTDDPLDNFTNDAMFYFGRGVTMYELYITPGLLDKGEWNALSKSLKWAEDRFDVLQQTRMVGGDPTRGEPYGYVHFRGDSGILAVRNPSMKAGSIRLKLDPADGLDAGASSLVLERVYPTRWISPSLYAAGATVDLLLDGYETAVYEVFPLDAATRPLLAGVTFTGKDAGGSLSLAVLDHGSRVRILNPSAVSAVSVNGTPASADDITLPAAAATPVLRSKSLHFKGASLTSRLDLDASSTEARFVVFLHPDAVKGKASPEATLTIDGKKVTPTVQSQKGVWSVYSFPLPQGQVTGRHSFVFTVSRGKHAGTSAWKGRADVWVIAQQKRGATTVTLAPRQGAAKGAMRPMPPSPYDAGALPVQVHLGGGRLAF